MPEAKAEDSKPVPAPAKTEPEAKAAEPAPEPESETAEEPETPAEEAFERYHRPYLDGDPARYHRGYQPPASE